MANIKSKLQIKLLSGSGELLNCINCFGGQVSVLRATSNSDLLPYLRAISGNTGPERFMVELDGEPFHANDHNIIGFGERFLGGDGSIEDFFISAGAAPGSLSSLLLSFGLENKLQAQCSQLTRCEERRARILAATFSPNKLIICNDPFDPISSEWRERFAELLVNFARTKKQIVIIPSLSYRPECWIDNDFVARIQVGENIQKTVGFTNQSTNVQSLVSEMRSQFHTQPSAIVAAPAINEAEQDDCAEVDNFVPSQQSLNIANLIRDKRLLALPLVLLVLIVVVIKTKSHKQEMTALDATQQAVSVQIENQPAANIEPPVNINVGANVVEVKNPPQAVNENPAVPVQVAMLIDSYPEPIKKSILDAVDAQPVRISVSMPVAPQTSGVTQSSKSKEAGDFLRLLQYAGKEDGSNENSVSEPEVNNQEELPQNPVDEQERREQIRKKFLEAIQRAQDRRAQEG